MLQRRGGRRQGALHVDMTPMVDVMMLLVIFFMMSTVFVASLPGFSINLPKAAADKQPVEDIAVSISRSGQIAVNGESVLQSHLAAKISALNSGNCNVLIKADKDVRHGQVVEVMETIRESGIVRLAIAVDDKGR